METDVIDDTLLSVQLYSLRDLPTLREQLEAVRSANLSLVEMTSSNYESPALARQLLDDLGLAPSGGHIGIEPLRERFDWVLETCHTLGMKMLVLWGFPEDEQPRSGEDWRRAGFELGTLAESLAEHGITFAFHNHDWELEVYDDGDRALDKLFQGARGSALKWEPDVAWLARGNAPVARLLAVHRALIAACHVKDLAPAGTHLDEDGWADLGEGTLDWERWWPQLRSYGTRLMVLEHDQPSDPARFLARSASRARALARTHARVAP